jgi:hypothetical protein
MYTSPNPFSSPVESNLLTATDITAAVARSVPSAAEVGSAIVAATAPAVAVAIPLGGGVYQIPELEQVWGRVEL